MKSKWLMLMSLSVVLLGGSIASAAGDAHGGEPSLFGMFPEQIVTSVTTLVIFAMLCAVLGKYAWGPIASGLKAREDRIRKDIDDAEATRKRAEATLREYNDRLAQAEARVSEMIGNATREGEKAAENIRIRAKQEAEEIRERATREIETAREEAVAAIYRDAAEISTKIAEKIIRRNLNADDQRELVRQSLAELSKVGSN